MHTRRRPTLQTAVRNLAEKAAAFGIPGYIVDGNDVIACYEVTKQAIDYARSGRGAVLIEAKTYRRKGHAEHDDQRYVPGRRDRVLGKAQRSD